MKKLLTQIIKFGLVGFLCFFIDYGIMVFLTEVAGVHYLLSSGISFTVSVIVNYVLSLTYVFETEKGNRIKEFIIFVVLSVIGLGINQALMWFCVDMLGIFYMISKIGATAVVMVYNFITRKVVLEKKDKRLAQVVMENSDFPEVSLPADLNRVEGLAGEKDFARYDENLLKAEKSMGVVADLIAQNQLEMKVVDIVFPLNCSYVLISFVAEKRVDFRQLLKDLASYFKTRIELRQISSREESKIYGGLGPCGRALCCSSFLGDFPPVSIKMAKNQSLSLNSGKMNGVCGRLMCCLSYEDDFYRDSKASYPDLGDDIETKDGTGQVVAIDVIAGTIKVVFEKGRAPLTYGVEEVQLNGKA